MAERGSRRLWPVARQLAKLARCRGGRACSKPHVLSCARVLVVLTQDSLPCPLILHVSRRRTAAPAARSRPAGGLLTRLERPDLFLRRLCRGC